MSISYDTRPDCAAPAHDTVWAYDYRRCRCAAAIAAKDRRRGPRPKPQPVDPDRVQAAVNGKPVPLTVAERRAAIDALAHLPAVKVAAVLRIGRSTVFERRRNAQNGAAA